MNTGRVTFCFQVLLAIGLFIAVWGVAGPTIGGAAFSEALVERLDLPRAPDVYIEAGNTYEQSLQRHRASTILLGVMI